MLFRSLLGALRSKEIYQCWIEVFGVEVFVRMEPLAFKRELRRISHLIDENRLSEAREAIEDAYGTWGCDSELVRAQTLLSFLGEEVP